MTVTHVQTTNQALMYLAAEALAAAPHFTPAQKDTRTEAVIHTIMAFLPAEPVQTMLASQSVGHHFTLLDTFREITNRALPDTMSMRLRAITCMQTKMTLALIKELRAVRKEMHAAAETGRAAAEAGQPEDKATDDDAAFAQHATNHEDALIALDTTMREAHTLDKPTAEQAIRHLEKAVPPDAVRGHDTVTRINPPPAAPVWRNRAQRRAAGG